MFNNVQQLCQKNKFFSYEKMEETTETLLVKYTYSFS